MEANGKVKGKEEDLWKHLRGAFQQLISWESGGREESRAIVLIRRT